MMNHSTFLNNPNYTALLKIELLLAEKGVQKIESASNTSIVAESHLDMPKNQSQAILSKNFS